MQTDAHEWTDIAILHIHVALDMLIKQNEVKSCADNYEAMSLLYRALSHLSNDKKA